jgi:hypothetical protein
MMANKFIIALSTTMEMNCHKHRYHDKFGLGMTFNVHASLKGKGAYVDD